MERGWEICASESQHREYMMYIVILLASFVTEHYIAILQLSEIIDGNMPDGQERYLLLALPLQIIGKTHLDLNFRGFTCFSNISRSFCPFCNVR